MTGPVRFSRGFTLSLTEDMHRFIQAESARLGVTYTEVARRMLDFARAANDPPPPNPSARGEL